MTGIVAHGPLVEREAAPTGRCRFPFNERAVGHDTRHDAHTSPSSRAKHCWPRSSISNPQMSQIGFSSSSSERRQYGSLTSITSN